MSSQKGMKRSPEACARIRAGRKAVTPPLDVRFAALVDKSGGPDACWHWTGAKHRDGYGVVWDGVTTQKAHRLALRLSGIEPPDRKATGLVVDHLCKNRACVNPAHMRIVSQRTNTLENSACPHAANAAKTHCKPHGHPYAGDNLHYDVVGGKLRRICIACTRLRKPATKLKANTPEAAFARASERTVALQQETK